MTGITRVSKESVFSDLNNLKVVTTTSRQYARKQKAPHRIPLHRQLVINDLFIYLHPDGSALQQMLEYLFHVGKRNAVWSLLLASGYLKVKNFETHETEYGEWKEDYELELIICHSLTARLPIRTFFPQKAKPYLRIHSAGIPFATRPA
mgnify:CR=1 FL=1